MKVIIFSLLLLFFPFEAKAEDLSISKIFPQRPEVRSQHDGLGGKTTVYVLSKNNMVWGIAETAARGISKNHKDIWANRFLNGKNNSRQGIYYENLGFLKRSLRAHDRREIKLRTTETGRRQRKTKTGVGFAMGVHIGANLFTQISVDCFSTTEAKCWAEYHKLTSRYLALRGR